jgi:hypothetical protein
MKAILASLLVLVIAFAGCSGGGNDNDDDDGGVQDVQDFGEGTGVLQVTVTNDAFEPIRGAQVSINPSTILTRPRPRRIHGPRGRPRL